MFHDFKTPSEIDSAIGGTLIVVVANSETCKLASEEQKISASAVRTISDLPSRDL